MSSVWFYFKGFIFTESLIFYLMSVFSARLNASPFLLMWKRIMSTPGFALPLTEGLSGSKVASAPKQVDVYWEPFKDLRKITILKEITVILLFLYLAWAQSSSLNPPKMRRWSSGFAWPPKLKKLLPKGRNLLKSFAGFSKHHLI